MSILDHICFTLVWLISLIALYCFARVYVLCRRRKGRSRTLNFEEPMFDVVPCWLLFPTELFTIRYSSNTFFQKKLGKKKLTNIGRCIPMRIRWYSWGRPHEYMSIYDSNIKPYITTFHYYKLFQPMCVRNLEN